MMQLLITYDRCSCGVDADFIISVTDGNIDFICCRICGGQINYSYGGQIMKEEELIACKNKSLYQKCPACDGTGLTIRPPWIAGDKKVWVSSDTGPYACKCCNGSGIILLPPNQPCTCKDVLA